GYCVRTAKNGIEALAAIEREPPDLVMLDVMMPGPNGFEVCAQLKSNPHTRLIPVVLITSLSESDHKIQGINSGADDFLTKPINISELRARTRSLIRLKRYTDDLDTAESVIISLAMTIEARDRYTDGHCQRLASYALALGKQLELDDDDMSALYRGGFL